MSETCEECYSEVDEDLGCDCTDAMSLDDELDFFEEEFDEFEDDISYDLYEDEEPIFEIIEPEWDTGPTVDDLIDELIEIGHLR